MFFYYLVKKTDVFFIDFNVSEVVRETMDVKEGDDVTLKCSADGIPTPFLRWDFIGTGSSSSVSENTTASLGTISTTVGNATESVNNLEVHEHEKNAEIGYRIPNLY